MTDAGLASLLAVLALVNALVAFMRSKIRLRAAAFNPPQLADAKEFTVNPFSLEGFWRAFAINLGFAGVSVVVGAKVLGMGKTVHYSADPILWGCISFVLSIVVAVYLDDDYNPEFGKLRWKRITAYVVASILVYGKTYAATSAVLAPALSDIRKTYPGE